MSRKKYQIYTLVSENSGSEVFNTYAEAFANYHSTDSSATLYGTNEFGEQTIIFSK